MKKLVFDLPTYVERALKRDISKRDLLDDIFTWAFDCHGKTKEECKKEGYEIIDVWCKEIEVPLEFNGVELKVGQCFVTNLSKTANFYYKIKSVHDNYFMVDVYEQNGTLFHNGITKWYPSDIYKLIDEPKPYKEMTVAEIEKALGHKVKVIK